MPGTPHGRRPGRVSAWMRWSVATGTRPGPAGTDAVSRCARHSDVSPRSVRFRAEIGPVPRRDRFTSAPRSVEFRTEIGSVPHRDHECAVPAAHFPKFLDGKRPGIFTCRESAPSTPASAFLRDSRVRHSVSAARTFALSGAPSVVCALQLLSRGSLGVVSDEVPRAPGARPAAAGRSAAASGSHVCANIDLEPEMDRSRRGTEPISTRN